MKGSGCNHGSYVTSELFKETSAQIASQPCGVYLFTTVMSRADDDSLPPPPPPPQLWATNDPNTRTGCLMKVTPVVDCLGGAARRSLGSSRLFFSTLAGSRVFYERQSRGSRQNGVGREQQRSNPPPRAHIACHAGEQNSGI